MKYYAVVPDREVPTKLRLAAWELCDDLSELLGLPVVVEFVRETSSATRAKYTYPVPLLAGVQPACSVIFIRADIPWDAAQLEQTVCHEFGHLAIARLGREQSEQRADLLGEYLARQLWRFRLAKLRALRKRLLARVRRAQDSGRRRFVPAWAKHRPTIEFRTMEGR
jgi:hypothetical protein